MQEKLENVILPHKEAGVRKAEKGDEFYQAIKLMTLYEHEHVN